MPIFLDRIDSAPVNSDELSFEFNSWFSVTVDTINESLTTIQARLNRPQLEGLTQAQIVADAVNAPDGSIWYSSDDNVFVGKEGGALVQFTTTPYP